MTQASPTPSTDRFALRAAIVGPLSAFPKDPVAPAPDWLFVTGYGRTGGMALTRMLNEHPDCQLTIEDGTVHLLAVALTSELFQVESDFGPTCKAAHGLYTLAELRALCDCWKRLKCRGAKVGGDKLYMLWPMRDQLAQLFPGSLTVFTYRHPLDQLVSYIKLGAHWLEPDGTPERSILAADFVVEQVAQIKQAQALDRVATVPFEALARQSTRLKLVDHLWSLAGLGPNAAALARVAAPAYDAPDGAIGRHRHDRAVTIHLQDWRNLGQLDRVVSALRSLGYSEGE